MKLQSGLHWTRLLWTRPCGAKPRHASPNHHIRSALFWDVQRRAVIPYCRFSTTYQSQLQGSKSPKERTDHDWSSLTQSSFLGLCQSSNFLKKHDISEFGCVSTYSGEETPSLVGPLEGGILNHWALGHSNLLRYLPENRCSPRIITGKWLLKN